MVDHTHENLARLMAAGGLSIEAVVQRTGLDRRTIQAILRGDNRPHARTLKRLAEGLGVSTDELFLDPARLLYRHFDRATNPLVDEALETHADLFADWSEADFDELRSCMGTGGPLTLEGTLAVAQRMNRRRRVMEKVALLLQTGHEECVTAFVDALYGRIVAIAPPEAR